MTIRLTTAVSLLLPLGLLAGCDMDVGRTGGPVMNEAQQASDLNPGNAAAPADPTPQPATAPAPQPQPMPPAKEESTSHVGKQTKEILNVVELENDPNWSVVASDPSQVKGFTAPGTAFNRAAALGGTAGLEQWVKLEQASSGTFPTYKALEDYLAKNPGVDMPALREYQHYGYDERSGQIVILENKEEKTARRKELNLPVEP